MYLFVVSCTMFIYYILFIPSCNILQFWFLCIILSFFTFTYTNTTSTPLPSADKSGGNATSCLLPHQKRKWHRSQLFTCTEKNTPCHSQHWLKWQQPSLPASCLTSRYNGAATNPESAAVYPFVLPLPCPCTNCPIITRQDKFSHYPSQRSKFQFLRANRYDDQARSIQIQP